VILELIKIATALVLAVFAALVFIRAFLAESLRGRIGRFLCAAVLFSLSLGLWMLSAP
jgi:hypothetical protein